MNSKTEQLEQKNQKLKMAENTQRIVTDGVILIAGVLMAAVCGHFAEQGTVSADQAMVAVIAMISSFGATDSVVRQFERTGGKYGRRKRRSCR